MPPTSAPDPAPAIAAWTRRILVGRGVRAVCDGFVAVLLPVYLQALGFGVLEIGVLSTLTLAGSAIATLSLGALGHRLAHDRLLRGAAVLMTTTGIGFAAFSGFWPLALVAFAGTLNPSSGDVSVFQPIEHARLAQAGGDTHARTRLFARYTFTGSLCAALGALASGLPALLEAHAGVPALDALRAMFGLYGLAGAFVWVLYRRLPRATDSGAPPPAPLRESRRVVWRLAALFSVDAFAGGLLVNALLALWLFERFGLSPGQAGAFFFWSGLLATGSQWVAPHLARRIGLLNTMVYTHIPASMFLIAAAFASSLPVALALLFARSALSQMDVPARSAYVMAVVTPPERVAAASFTAVPRSLAAALGPTLGGALLGAGMLAAPLIVCGGLKIAYDLALLASFRRQRVE